MFSLIWKLPCTVLQVWGKLCIFRFPGTFPSSEKAGQWWAKKCSLTISRWQPMHTWRFLNLRYHFWSSSYKLLKYLLAWMHQSNAISQYYDSKTMWVSIQVFLIIYHSDIVIRKSYNSLSSIKLCKKQLKNVWKISFDFFFLGKHYVNIIIRQEGMHL